jgi:hypothetical protein
MQFDALPISSELLQHRIQGPSHQRKDHVHQRYSSTPTTILVELLSDGRCLGYVGAMVELLLGMRLMLNGIPIQTMPYLSTWLRRMCKSRSIRLANASLQFPTLQLSTAVVLFAVQRQAE